MLQGTLVLVVALGGLAMAVLLVRRRSASARASEPERGIAVAGGHSSGQPAVAEDFDAAPRPGATEVSLNEAIAMVVPNTKIEPHPEHEPVAHLEFSGPPGSVAVRRGETVIGRHSDDDVRLQDIRVSRRHARFRTLGNGRFEIENLTAARSTPNPMLVNGARFDRAEIADGDVVTLGGVSFKLRQASQRGPAG